jgi:alcohol dehydrogenase
MRAVVYESPGTVRLVEKPDPTIQAPEDIIVRVTTASICGSDLHIMHGRTPGVQPGTIIGHEFVGVVVEVGSAVTRFKSGDRVICPPAVWCGRCPACQRGLVSACERMGVFGSGALLGDLPGAQADYVRVPFADVILQPISAPDDRVIFGGDILPTGYSAVAGLSPNCHGVRAGDTVVVLGLGPVGLCAVASARLFDPALIVGVDSRTDTMPLARALGADMTVDATREDWRTAIKDETGGWGADFVVEAVGKPETVNNAIGVAAPGGLVSVVGAFFEPATINAGRMMARNVTLTLGLGDLTRVKQLVALLESGELDLTPLISHRMPLDEAERAYEIFDKKLEGVVKILLAT